MRLFAALAIALCLLQSKPPSPTRNKPSHPEQQQASPEQQKPASDQQPSGSSRASLQQPSTQVTIWNERESGNHAHQESSADWWARIFSGLVALFTAALAWLAYKQWGVLDKQREALREQADYMRRGVRVSILSARAARRSAIAAKKSADALINSERAWVMVDLTWQSGRGCEIFGAVGDAVSTSLALALTCRNEGKTPAWITLKTAAMRIVEHVPRYDDMPASMKGPITGDFVEVCTEPLSVGQQPSIKHFTLMCKGGREDGRFPLIFGMVEYRDVFKPNRATYFGYTVTKDRRLERIAGVDRYSDYNKNT